MSPGAFRTVPSTQGVEVVVHDLGGSGPLLVMAHATGFHGMVWKPLAAHLADDFRCVSFDFRGHGRTSVPDGADILWTSFASDLLAVVDAVSPDEPVRVIGHSMGAAAVVLADGLQGGRFVRPWLYEAIFLPTGMETEGSDIAEGAARRRPDFDSRDDAYENYASKPPLNSLHPDVLRHYVDHGFNDDPGGGVTLACRPETESLTFVNAACGGDQAALALTLETALVIGTGTGGPAQLSREIAPQRDNLTLFETELNHFGPLQDPAAMATAIRTWFT